MYIGEHLSTLYTEITPNDSVAHALELLNDLHVHQLPLILNQEYLGILSEEELLNIDQDSLLLKDIQFNLPFIYVYDFQHIYDAIQLISINQLDLLPILNKQNQYLGVVTQQDLLYAINKMISNQEIGAIIVLEMEERDHSLTHIANIIESENAKIWSTGVKQVEDSDKIELTIKLNKTNISSVLASLWRHDYVVKATFNDGSDQNDIQDRYNLLMNYLNL
ncbi:CBS domain-containing protein [Sphingobacterium sp. HJSM2_6]|uniref:CBS domain-containing protein n=1 Tax=Sphingobacterium sp. HJSM2_6 TaxID=3366264 RepID=UPI003BDA67A2